MSDELALAKKKAKEAYEASADSFDAPALSFWDRYGRKTIERLGLAPGSSVLDVCCGTGASAIPAAEAVGPSGKVLGIDLSENLLALARRKAAAKNLRHAEFRAGDMTATGFPEASFDAVVIVFGIFFVPDMEAQVRELMRMLKPGGKLAVTTWGPRLFEPLDSKFRASVATHAPELANRFNPWDRISTPEALRALLAAGRPARVEAAAESGTHALAAPEDWWTIIRGTGYRWTTDRLGSEASARVREEAIAAARGIASVETSVVYGTAAK